MGKKSLQWDWYWLYSQKKKKGGTRMHITQVTFLCASLQICKREWSVKSLETWVLHFLTSGCPVKRCHQPQGAWAGFLSEEETQWFRMWAAHDQWGDWGPINLVSREIDKHALSYQASLLWSFNALSVLLSPCPPPSPSPFSRRNSTY